MTDPPSTAVLLMGYGSPKGASDLPDYLREVLHGRPPDPAMVAEYVRRYDRIGGSPQDRILASLRAKLERRLRSTGPGWPVRLAVKHGRPALREVVPQLAREGFERLIAIPTSPYASLWISEPYRDGLAEGRRAVDGPLEIDARFGWHLAPGWIRYWAREIPAHRPSPEVPVLLSAHSLPQRMRDRGDPYPELLDATVHAIVSAARLDAWQFTYQSAGNTTEPWLGPDIVDVLRAWKARGATTQLVASFGFVFDHLEVLYDLDVVVREAAEAMGIELRRVPMPNDHDDVVEALASRVLGPSDPPAPSVPP